MKLIDGTLLVEEVVDKITAESVEATPKSNGDVMMKRSVSEQLAHAVFTQYKKFSDKSMYRSLSEVNWWRYTFSDHLTVVAVMYMNFAILLVLGMLQLLKVIYAFSHGVVFVKQCTCVGCTGAIVQ